MDRLTRQQRLSQRRQGSRSQREHRRQRIALALGVAVILVIIGVVAYGYYTNVWAPPRKMVVSINGVAYTRGDMVNALRVDQAGYAAVGQPIDLSVAPFGALNDLLYNELLHQAAPRLGIQVTPQDVEEEIRSRFYPVFAEDENPTQEELDREFKERIRNLLNQTKQSEEQLRRSVRFDIIGDKAREQLGQEVPQVAEQVYVQWINVTESIELAEIRQRLEEGTDFDALAKEMAPASGLGAGDGEVGWVPRGAFPDLDEVLFTIEHGKVSDPIGTFEGTTVLMVTQGPEMRPVSDGMIEKLKDQVMVQWLQTEIMANEVKTSFSSDDYAWIVKQLRESDTQGLLEGG